MNFDAVIFDLDGTLIASETVYLRAWRAAAHELGEAMTNELYVRVMGLNHADSIARLGQEWSSQARAEEFVNLSEWHYARMVEMEGHRVRPGVLELLDALESRGRRLAVATSTRRHLAEETLAAIGLEKRFNKLVAGDEVVRGKPDPEIYFLAAKRLGVSPIRCLVFEDSPAGVQAALVAGMTVIAVPELPLSASMFDGRVLTISSFRAALSLVLRE